ncbi:hypothetical protein [Novosphingobium sp.]|uniref:hypothetical protein n=1 Tax=Novosphingobium sp. TaxID=1874826 RepID=UPI0031D5FB8B
MTAPAPFGLRWEKPYKDNNCHHAMLGAVQIGAIGELAIEPGAWWYKVDGVDVKWLAKRNGQVKSRDSARKAVERAWVAWLKASGLMPADAPATSENPAHAREA